MPCLVRITALVLAASLAGSTSGCGGDDPDDGADTATGDGMADETASGEPDQSYVDGVLGALWADDVSLAVGSDAIVLTSDGVPNHDVLEAYALANTDETAGVVASDTTLTIPLTPEWSDTVTETGLGTIGLAISGAVYFNPYEGDGTSVALDGNFEVGGIPFLDSCSGHPLPDETTYHYHGVPYCITDVVDTAGEHSVMIGVLLDGYPVYGPLGEGGEAPSDLDECLGHEGATPEFPDGMYHYHLSETSPYMMTCYHGVVDNAGMPGSPPPGGLVE